MESTGEWGIQPVVSVLPDLAIMGGPALFDKAGKFIGQIGAGTKAVNAGKKAMSAQEADEIFKRAVENMRQSNLKNIPNQGIMKGTNEVQPTELQLFEQYAQK